MTRAWRHYHGHMDGGDQPSAHALDRHLLLYDGVCGMCNGLVLAVLARDRQALFDFAALQSAAGAEQLARFKCPLDLSTVVVIANHRGPDPVPLTKSRAALFVNRRAGLFFSTART